MRDAIAPTPESSGVRFVSPRGCAVTLPVGWTVSVDRHDLVCLQAPNAQGRPCAVVTVDEIARNFVLGASVRVPDDPFRKGRGWQARLFANAIEVLQACVDRHEASMVHGAQNPNDPDPTMNGMKE